MTVCLPGGSVGTGVAAARENGREVVSEACKYIDCNVKIKLLYFY